jgi:hypothetical protein
MKKITLLSTLRQVQCVTLCFLLLTLGVNAQTPPNAFNYSAVARNAAGQPIATTTIGMQIAILKTSPTGVSQYSENHFVNTDAFGLFNLVIGAGAVQSGSMTTIDWSNDNYYLKVGMDAAGGTNFLTMGTTQLLSVPYAMYAKSAGSVSGGANETDPLFGASVANGITGADTTNWNNKQNQLIAGSNITITGNTISASASSGGNYTSLKYPQGTNGDYVAITSNYNVPAGKTLYIISCNDQADFQVGSVSFGTSGFPVFPESTLISVGAGSYFTGVLVNSDPSLTLVMYSGVNYTVPAGKKLVLKSNGWTPGAPGQYMYFNGISLTGSPEIIGVFPSGSVFIPDNSNLGLTGYLINN